MRQLAAVSSVSIGLQLLSLSSIASVALAARTRLKLRQRTAEACQFVAHRPGDKEELETTDGPQVLFRSGSTAVVDVPPLRYLVSLADDGHCYEQAERTCGNSTSLGSASTANTSDVNTSSSSASACSSAPPCLPDFAGSALLSYLRSMAAGALVGKDAAPNRVGVLGMGSGALAAWASHTFPEAQVDAVDLSSAVVEAASCFGLQPDAPGLHLEVADGRKFLADGAGATGEYDALFVDAFDAGGLLPSCLATVEFFALAAERLSPAGGVMAINLGWHDDLGMLIAAISRSFLHVAVGGAPHETNRVVLASQMDLRAVAGGPQPPASGPPELAQWAADAAFKTAPKQSDDGLAAFTQPRTDSGEGCSSA